MNAEVETILAKWADAFGSGNGAAIAALYTPDAMFIGGIGGVQIGPEGIAGYFAAHAAPAKIVFRDVLVRPHGNDVVIVSMIGAISAAGGQPRDFRFMQTHVRTSDGWRIAGHHGSHSL